MEENLIYIAHEKEIAQLKVFLEIEVGDTSKDVLLDNLIDKCIAEFGFVTHRRGADTDLLYNYKSTILSMVVENYNRLGSEGVASQSFSGTSESLLDGYTANLSAAIKSCRKMRFL